MSAYTQFHPQVAQSLCCMSISLAWKSHHPSRQRPQCTPWPHYRRPLLMTKWLKCKILIDPRLSSMCATHAIEHFDVTAKYGAVRQKHTSQADGTLARLDCRLKRLAPLLLLADVLRGQRRRRCVRVPQYGFRQLQVCLQQRALHVQKPMLHPILCLPHEKHMSLVCPSGIVNSQVITCHWVSHADPAETPPLSRDCSAHANAGKPVT